MAGYAVPTQQNIQDFNELVPGLPPSEVLARLKNNNCNIDQAIGEYFDNQENPAGNKYAWEEGQFSSDRDGQMNHGVSFDIQGPDDMGPWQNFDGLKSRPPSRISNNRSPRQVIDLTSEHAAADARNSKPFPTEDDNMQRALAESLQDSRMQPQETGITSTNEVHFGPANRSEYPQSQWGIVPVGKSSAQEIILDPEPAERKRDPMATPAFLKPSTEDHRLGALLTIYFEIPKIREVFLDRGNVLPSYGFEREWWTGKAIELPTIYEDEEPSNLEVRWELQRLMAFLSKTDRSYGSADALASLNEVKKGNRFNEGIEPAVLNAWRDAPTTNQAFVNKIFSKGVPCEAEEDQFKSFAILELVLPANDSIHDSLYDLADEALWPSLSPLDFDQSPYLSHIADAIAFKIEGDETKRNIDVPLIWYPDRYLKSAKQTSLDMRLKKHDVQEELDRIAILEDSLTNFQMRNGKVVKVKDLFTASLQHDEARIVGEGDDSNADMLATRPPSKATNLSAELRKLMASIDKKLISLNEEREKAREALKSLSKLYTEAPLDPDAPKLHPYTLRGVSVTKNTFYVCRVSEPDLISMEVDEASHSFSPGQWWRIHFATSGASQVSVEKTTEEKVLEAAKSESKNITLVYASEKAMEFKLETQALPGPLETFVRNDNRAFKQELLENSSDDTQTQVSSSPGKRKYDEHSESSNGTPSRWTGSSPRDHETTASLLERDISENGEMSFDNARIASRRLSAGLGDWHDQSNGRADEETIIGVDPSLLNSNGQSNSQEMQERAGSRFSMMPSAATKQKESTIDSMDLDEVVEDTLTVEESGAVKHVGFAE